MIVIHRSSSFLRERKFIPYDKDNPKYLSNTEASELSTYLSEDAKDFLYNAMLSIGSGIKSLSIKNYGWATVKFYYAVFYLARANLGIQGVGICYDKNVPFVFLSSKDEKLNRSKISSTHKLTFNTFEEKLNDHIMLGNDINGEKPFAWFMQQREIMNYKSVVMPDPAPSCLYEEIVKKPVRQWLNLYLEDANFIYPFLPDHACLAYPIRFLIKIIDDFKNRGLSCIFLKENSDFIQKLFSDKSGSFNFLLKEFDRLK